MNMKKLEKKLEKKRDNVLGKPLWLMMSSGIYADLEDVLDDMILNGSESETVKMINKNNECVMLEVDKQWLIDQLCD